MMETTRKQWFRLAADEHGQSSVFAGLGAVVCIIFPVFLLVSLVPAAHAGQAGLYHGEGGNLFSAKGSALIHMQPLEEAVTRLNNDQAITGVEIAVTCPVKGGGRELAAKRGEALTRFFKQRLRRSLPIHLVFDEKTAPSVRALEQIRKAMGGAAQAGMARAGGPGTAGDDLDYLNTWDMVEISGSGPEVMDDPIFYEIDQQLGKLPANDPHVAMLRHYRKILKTMADLQERLPHYPDSSSFEPHGDEMGASLVRRSRERLAELVDRELPLAEMAVKMAKEVYQVALAIHREHPFAEVPPYKEENGDKHLRAMHVMLKYYKKARDAAWYEYRFFKSHKNYMCEHRKDKVSYGLADGLDLIAETRSRKDRRRFTHEQVALNNFVREHLGLSLIPPPGVYSTPHFDYKIDYTRRLPICNALYNYNSTTGDGPPSYIIRYMTDKEEDELYQESIRFWETGCRFPPADKLESPRDPIEGDRATKRRLEKWAREHGGKK